MLRFFIAFSLFSQVAGAAIQLKPYIPADNPISNEKVELGKQLFFDKRLSMNSAVSCNSCHNVMGSGTDNKPFSEGFNKQLGGRNAPTVWNSAFWTVQFWDGRAASLEEQAKGPMTNPVEMGMPNHNAVVEVIAKVPAYQKSFKKVFGGNTPVNIDNVAKAIAAYERTLIALNSPYDDFSHGNKKALDDKAQKGWAKFQSVGCVSCHSGPHFAGPIQTPGQGFYMKFPTFPNTEFDKKYQFSKDLGRFEVTKNETDKNTWRVPSLRNVALTAPYFHNAAVGTLDEAVRIMAKTQLNRDLNNDDVEELVSFLKSLTSKLPKQTEPKLPL